MKRLGIDIGSTTVKVAVIDEQHNILFSDYQRHFAKIQETLSSLLKKAKDQIGEMTFAPTVTGSGGLSISSYLDIPFCQEVVCVSSALHSDSRTPCHLHHLKCHCNSFRARLYLHFRRR